VSDSEQSRPYDDVDYMRGGKAFNANSSILRSTSKYLNSPLVREVWSNEGLRCSGPDVFTTSLIPEFYEAFGKIMDEADVARMFKADAERLPELRAWLDERYCGNITYDQVKDCAPGTLGYGVKQLLDGGFQLYFGRLGPAESDFDYVRKRRAQVHDMEHIITGFPGTALAGEIALFLTNMVSTYSYFQPKLAKEIALVSSFLMSAWTLRTALHNPEVMVAICDAMEKGSALGKRLKRPLFMERWEDYLDWPTPKIRAHFGLPEPEGFVGPWDWVEPQEYPPEVTAPRMAAE
jgi:ubiquinone biosynthesis protein COQ4